MPRTILLVEDNEETMALMATALAKQGHQVVQAWDTLEATRLWSEAEKPFDLLISDVRFSDEEDDGFVLARKLLESQPQVPVMFVSGDPDCFASPALQAFADSPFMKKPFNLTRMAASVANLLAKSQSN